MKLDLSVLDPTHYEQAVVPRHGTRLGSMLLEKLDPELRGTVLEVACRTGWFTAELLKRVHRSGRIVAIDPDARHVEAARLRLLETDGKRTFFKCGAIVPLPFGDHVFDIIVGNPALAGTGWITEAAADLRRALQPRGQLVFADMLRGTFEEMLDMVREAALAKDLDAVVERVDAAIAEAPTKARLLGLLHNHELSDVDIETESLKWTFRNARTMMKDPLVAAVALPAWKRLCPADGETSILDEAAHALDTYFAGSPVSLRIEVAVIVARG